MFSGRFRAGALGLAAVAAVLLAACGSSGRGSNPTAAPPAPANSSTVSGAAPAAGATTLTTATTPLGPTLVDGSGHTIYLFTADSAGMSACTGACLQHWPVVPPVAATSFPGITATLGTLTRADGREQLTVDGRPAYTFAGDTTPDATTGQGLNAFGGLWWAMTAAGKPITHGGAASAGLSGSTGTKGGSYGSDGW